ncbi:MAG TPA: hypothetical protein VGO67_03090 [Verrucomicrobiae bacterium]|jgi:hypothetical protein
MIDKTHPLIDSGIEGERAVPIYRPQNPPRAVQIVNELREHGATISATAPVLETLEQHLDAEADARFSEFFLRRARKFSNVGALLMLRALGIKTCSLEDIAKLAGKSRVAIFKAEKKLLALLFG